MIKNDPVINVVFDGIVSPIKILLEKDHLRAALQLTFCGIDAMAYLSLEDGREKSTRKDFVAWCDRYITFKNTVDTVSGLELYASRSGLVHKYKTESNLSDEGKVRILEFFFGNGPDIIFTPQESERHVLVRIHGLVEAFFSGVNEFIVEVVSKYPERTERRLNTMLRMMYV